MRDRPIGITILALFQATVGGLAGVFFGLMLLLLEFVSLESLEVVAGVANENDVSQAVLLTYGSVAFIAGLLFLIGAVGLWLMRRWGWFTSVVAWIANIVITATQMLTGNEDLVLLEDKGVFPSPLRVIVSALIVIYLLLPKIRQTFARAQ